jgi:DHA2 family multidrug resistance protein
MSWVQTSYLIAEIVTIPLTGVLMRMFSMRRLLIIAITLFTAASVGCAMSNGFAMLVGFRVLQGMAAGVLMPLVFAAVFLLFKPGTEQGIATVLAAVVAVIAPSTGPIVGGIITETFSWQWLFLINTVPGAITLLLGALCLPREKMELGLLRDLDLLSILFIAGYVQGYSIKALLSLPGMMMAEIAAVIVTARCNEWKDAYLPWWNFMIAVLGMTIILLGSAFWMKSLGDQNWPQLIKAMYTGILMLSAFLRMVQQLLWRLIKGREFYYKKK